MSKTVRQISIVGSVVLLAVFIYISQILSKAEPIAQRIDTSRKIAPVVEVTEISNGDISFSVPVQGRLIAYDKIDIFSEVNGALLNTTRPFKEGSHFQKGEVILEIDSKEAGLNLLAQKSLLLNAITQFIPDLKIDYPESFPNWKAYLDNFDAEKPLLPFPTALSNQEKMFIASHNVNNQYYSIKSAEARLEKYKIYAPFSGVITETAINPGAVVRANQKLGVLMNTSAYELEGTMPVSDLKYIKPGHDVTVFSKEFEKEWKGKVKRINDRIDPSTQTATIYIGLSGSDLREGMYLQGNIHSGKLTNAVKIDRDLLVDQEYVFVLKDTVLERIQVELTKMEGNEAIVRGLTDGTFLLSRRIPNAYNGMRVRRAPAQ